MLDVTQTYFTCDTNIYIESDRNHVEIVATSIDIDKPVKIRFSENSRFHYFCYARNCVHAKSQLFM